MINLENFLVFYSYPYKGLIGKNSIKCNLNGKNEKHLAYCLIDFFEIAENAFVLSGIDAKGIKSEAEKIKAKSFSEALQNIQIKKTIENHVKKPELSETAESYFLYCLMRKFNENYFPSKKELEALGIKEHFESIEEKKGIGMMINFNGWTIVKKLSYEDAEDFMISGTIASIHDSIINKFWKFLGYQEVKKKSKSVQNFVKSVAEAESKKGIERNYSIYKAFIENGYFPYATLEMLAKAYPQLKPKKPRGKLPKN